LDINELAALNDDISTEFIEQLQNQITQTSNLIEKKSSKTDVTTLFEEVPKDGQTPAENTDGTFVPHIDASIDDNFIKKYKAKLEKQKNAQNLEALEAQKAQAEQKPEPKSEPKAETSAPAQPEVQKPEKEKKKKKEDSKKELPTQEEKSLEKTEAISENNAQIEALTNGNIVEKQATPEQIEYNESLDFLDDNVKYSKYVVYIDPENTEFIESLTVKERKNLINRILKEQDNIVITQKRLNSIQTYIKHAIVAILTVAIATPIIYFTINASLEATINNHRRSQTIFKTLYKEKGKIKNLQY
jgi:hypothetical protein